MLYMLIEKQQKEVIPLCQLFASDIVIALITGKLIVFIEKLTT